MIGSEDQSLDGPDGSGGPNGEAPSRPAHAPVLLEEATAALAPSAGGVIVDATFGGGGYSRAFLGAANCRVWALDRDASAVSAGRVWARAYAGRLQIVETRFSRMEEALAAAGVEAVDGVAFDFGVSSMQIDQAGRGFSFLRDGPLDMRMGGEGASAADVIAHADAAELQSIFSVYGEERKSKTVAAAIVAARKDAPIVTTARLADIVSEAVGGRKGARVHPATRVFQALRIFVNDELGEIVRGLEAAERLLRPAGRLVAVSFHSLEDRLVKRFLADRSGRAATGSRHAPPEETASAAEATFTLLRRKPTAPSDGEADLNPRARSAKLRAAIRTAAPCVSSADRGADLSGWPPRPVISSRLEERMSFV
ncbi:MAG: 16S rRNA (cytosine(1402)-N(4))-methyltransferase RsmH [Pseudomonadota bacterium]